MHNIIMHDYHYHDFVSSLHSVNGIYLCYKHDYHASACIIVTIIIIIVIIIVIVIAFIIVTTIVLSILYVASGRGWRIWKGCGTPNE